MTDLIGPASSLNAVTARPSDGRNFGAIDTWFKDCTTPASQDGTQVVAAWLNQVTGLLRSTVRAPGLRADGITPVVPQDQGDAMVANAIVALIQRGQSTFGVDAGSADALAVTPLGGNVAEYKAGMALFVLKGPSPNATALPTINVDGLGAVPITRRDRSAVAPGDLPGGVGFMVWHDGQVFRLLGFAPSDVVLARRYHAAGDADVAIGAQDGVVATSIGVTSPRTWTLPAANSVSPGRFIALIDPFGAASNACAVTVRCTGADTINGQSSEVLTAAYFQILAYSDGVSRWSFQFVDPTQVAGIEQLLSTLAAEVAADEFSIAGLMATVAALTTALKLLQTSTATAITALQQQLAGLESRQVTTSTGSALTIIDYYTDASGLTLGSGYTVGGGLGFPTAASTPGAFSPVNPNASNLAPLGGRYIMPAYTEVVSSEVVPTDAGSGVNQGGSPLTGVAFNQMIAVTATVLMRGFGVERTRYGAAFQAQPSANLLANSDPSVLFALHPGDIAIDPSWTMWSDPKVGAELSHQNGYVHDLTGRGYWVTKAPGSPLNGLTGITQLVTPGSDQMMTSFALSVVKGTVGDIRMLVFDVTATGSVDTTQCVADVTCPLAAIDPAANIAGLYGVATFKMPYPILEKLGKTYAYFFGTTGDHKFRVKTQVNYNPQLGGNVLVGLTQLLAPYGCEVAHRKKVASFASISTDVPLNPFVNGTGTDTVDVITPAIVPTGCDIGFKMQTTGGSLTALGPITATAPNLLAGRPSNVVLTATLTGTGTTAPMIDLGTSVSGTAASSSAKQAGTLTAESAVRAPKDANGNAIPVTKVARQVFLSGFIPGTHTFTENLETGATFATITPPTATTPPAVQPDGTTLITFSWTLSSAVTSFKEQMLGTTPDTSKQFTIAKAITTTST